MIYHACFNLTLALEIAMHLSTGLVLEDTQ
jgi:hypothetical protein